MEVQVTFWQYIIDDYSSRVWSFFLKYKSDVFSAFKKWKIMIEKKIKHLFYDNGLEFCKFNCFHNSNGIARHHKILGTPQQNGVARQKNQTSWRRFLIYFQILVFKVFLVELLIRRLLLTYDQVNCNLFRFKDFWFVRHMLVLIMER